MSICRLVLVCLMALATARVSSGQRLYVFAVVDPSPRYRPDADRLTHMADSLARYGHYTLHWYSFVHRDAFTAQVIRETLANFQPNDADRDVIWFHYAGRGYSDSPEAWPTFRLTQGHIAVRDVLATLRARPVRTLLVTVDCANQLLPNPIIDTVPNQPNRPIVVVRPSVTDQRPVDSSNMTGAGGYRRLMQASRVRQLIIMSAASHGQRSYRTSGQGSVWLARFDLVIRQQLQTHPVDLSWKRIQEHVARLTQEKTQHRQTPQFNRQTITCCETDSL